jgi:hypothetical protein
VDKLGVGAHRDDIAAHRNEALVLRCQSSELGRADEGEVRGVEEDGPAPAGDLPAQAERSEVLVVSSKSGTAWPSFSPWAVSRTRGAHPRSMAYIVSVRRLSVRRRG